MVKDYLEKVYSGFLGMNIGIRLGAPVEPTIWTYDRIRNTYGEITDYVKEFKNFAADDDANGPVFFIRALYDDAKDRELVPQDVARAWLNYAREGVGMFWWGGYGISTEHTAYLNLKNGIEAPQSGSVEQNGLILAEQIGGQIFIDTWGLVNPCNPEKAAHYGEAAASVSHGGEGVLGARFFCAAIAKAFETDDIFEIMETGLAQIPKDSLYHQVASAVLEFYHAHPEEESWRSCYEMLVRDWGYDKYQGVCHIIPNAGVCFMAMAYGKGRFDRTVEIATMAGWDTDCNAGNVGTVLGVACGLKGLPERYRKPVNDGIVCSGISGYLNILDIPTFSKELALLGYRLSGEEAPACLAESFKNGEIHFDFELPGSTHNMRVSDLFFCALSHSGDQAFSGSGSLKILVDRMVRGDQCKVFYKPFYTRNDFSDERYSPVFSPTAYPGQTVSMKLYLDQWEGWETLGIAPYVHTVYGKEDLLQGYIKLVQEQWISVEFTIPDVEGDIVDEVGIVIEGYSPSKKKSLGLIYLDDFAITGPSAYTIDIKKQKKEFGCVTPFATDHGAWDLYGKTLNLMRCEEAFAYTGNYYGTDYTVSAAVIPRHGASHLITARAQGAKRFYAAGFDEKGKAVLLKNDFGFTVLAECGFDWEYDREYRMQMECRGGHIIFSVDGVKVLEAEDDSFSYGMFGCGSVKTGRTSFADFTYNSYTGSCCPQTAGSGRGGQ